MNSHPSLLRRLLGLLLGLFVLWQLLFLLGWNLLLLAEAAKPRLEEADFVQRLAPDWPRGEGEAQEALDAVERVPRRWAELTGQPQDWSLFAPNVLEDIAFPVVELRWDDDRLPARAAASLTGTLAAGRPLEAVAPWAAAGHFEAETVPPPVRLLSDNEPPDKGRFFRVGHFRLRRYEGEVVGRLDSDDTRPPTADERRGQVEMKLRREGSVLLAYLRWRLGAFRRSHPDLSVPRQVVLGGWSYHIPPPPGPAPWDWQRPRQPEPVVRWLPGREPGPEYYPLEMYNPVMERFESLRRPR